MEPVFNETFKFNVSSSPSRKYFTSSTNRLLRPQVSYGDVMGKTLVFAVFDFDRFTKNDEIGEVVIVSVEGGSVTSHKPFVSRFESPCATSTWPTRRNTGRTSSQRPGMVM